MKKKAICTLGLAALVVAFFWILTAPEAEGYPRYHPADGTGDITAFGFCSETTAQCLSDADCGGGETCSTPYRGCYQCHGWDNDANPVAGTDDQSPFRNNGFGAGPGPGSGGAPFNWGAGLRKHHANANAPADFDGNSCITCHTSDPVPLPEDVVPLYYEGFCSVSTAVPCFADDDCPAGETCEKVYAVNANDPCNSDGSEDWGSDQGDGGADLEGLDNDGDLAYDGADTDCQAAAVCGNGTVEGSEECDDGNTLPGDCCASNCTFESAGSSCGDSSDTECDNPDSCDGAGACEVNNEPAGFSCGDQGVECLIDDACDGAGACRTVRPAAMVRIRSATIRIAAWWVRVMRTSSLRVRPAATREWSVW
jgi:cysteine-rich repeat protein/Cys-rich repeat protein